MAKKPARPSHRAPAKAKEETRKSGKKSFDNTNRGVLFQNDKDGNEARPDMTGNIHVEIPDGAEPGDVIKFRLAAWEKESENVDGVFLSLALSEFKDKGKKSEDD